MADASLPEGFQLDQPAAPASIADSAGAPPPGFELDETHYGTPGQTALAIAEGASKGVLGSTITAGLEKFSKLKELSPQNQEARAEAHPVASGLAEAGAFAGSLFTGTGEAALLGIGRAS